MAALLFAAIFCLGSYARAEPVAKAELTRSSQGQTWSFRGATVAAPLERFPIFGFSFGVDLELSQRWRVSSTLTLQIPYSYGDVTRYLFALDAQAQLRLLSAWRLHWYAGLGIGVGVFHDDFAERSVFSNQTRVAPGLVASSTLEVNITTGLRAYLELRALAYRRQRVDPARSRCALDPLAPGPWTGPSPGGSKDIDHRRCRGHERDEVFGQESQRGVVFPHCRR